MPNNKNEKEMWAIGGGLMMGLGIGFFFLQASPLAFVGSILSGLGFGLMVSAILSKLK